MQMPTRRPFPSVSREAIQKLRERLADLAKTRNPNAAIPSRVSRPRAVQILRREIAAAFRKGYEIEDLLAQFAQAGFEIDAESFREYWRETRKKKSGSNGIE